jgi:hypothetical protein
MGETVKAPKVVASYADSRARQKTYGLTSEELEEAMTMYVEEKSSEATEAIIGEYDAQLENKMDDALCRIIAFFMGKAFDRGFTEGMKLAENTYDLVNYYKDAKERKATSLVQDYEFEEGKGVSGVLFPDGTFQKCGNAEHQFLLADIPLEVQFTCLYFSSSMRADGDGVISNSPMQFEGASASQMGWMIGNFEFFDRGQKRRAQDFGIQKEREV